MPEVSIGVPVYDAEAYLAEALDSLLAQSFEDFEIVISDNASTDRTAEIGRSYQARDTRVRYFRSDRNLGAAWNFNRTFELSCASLFKWAACDDLHEPLFLERCVDVLHRDPSVVLSHTYVKMIDERGQPLRYDHGRACLVDGDGAPVSRPDRDHVAEAAEPEVRFRDVLYDMWWCVPTFGVIRRDAFLKTARHGSYWGADKVFLAELALLGRFHQVPETLFAKRVHRGCSYSKDAQELEEHIDTSGSQSAYQLMMFKDYAKMALRADIGGRQRIHCLSSLAHLTFRRRRPWLRLLPRLWTAPRPASGREAAELVELERRA